jgi:hypothetical protein
MLFFSVAGFVTLYALQRVVLVQPVHDQHDRALKLVISVSLRPNNERRHGPPPVVQPAAARTRSNAAGCTKWRQSD